MAHIEFILEDDFEEFAMAEPGGSRFLQAHGQCLGQAREAELTEGRFDLCHGVCCCGGSVGKGTR